MIDPRVTTLTNRRGIRTRQGIPGWVDQALCADADDPGLWTSEHAVDRRVAAQLCRQCPVINQCGLAAQEQGETWHVWGGIDRTRDAHAGRRPAAGRSPCVDCERSLRPSGVPADGRTVVHVGHGLCAACRRRKRRG